MAVTVTKIGSVTLSGAAASISCPSGVAAGHGVVIMVTTSDDTSTNAALSTTCAATDSAGNTYQQDAFADLSNTYDAFFVLSGAMAVAIAPGGHITVTPVNVVSNGESWVAEAFDVSSFASSGWLDQKATGGSTWTRSWNTGTTATTTHEPDVVFAFFSSETLDTITFPAGWTAVEPGSAGPSGLRAFYVAWKEVTALGAQNLTMSATADGINGAIAAYKEGSGGGAGSISAAINGTSAVAVELASGGAISAAIEGVSTVSAQLAGTGPISAAMGGSSTVSAGLRGTGSIAAVVGGTSAVTAEFASGGAISATIEGVSTLSAQLAGTGSTSAAMGGSSTVSAELAGTGSISTVGPIEISWTAPGGGADGYNVYRGSYAGGEDLGNPLNGGTLVAGTSFVDESPLAGQNFYVVYSSLGGVLSPASSEIEVDNGIAGASGVSASLEGTGVLAAVIAGPSTVGVGLASAGAISLAILGTSTVTCDPVGTGAISATIGGTSALAAPLVGTGAIFAVLEGASLVAMQLVGTGVILAAIDGNSEITADLLGIGIRPLYATSISAYPGLFAESVGTED